MEKGAEAMQIFSVLDHFFYKYLVERNVEAVLDLTADDIFSMGTGEEEIAFNKVEFAHLLTREIAALPYSLEYKIKDYREKQMCDGCWECCCRMETAVVSEENEETAYYQTRLTAVFREENGRYLASSLHMSEASRSLEKEEFFPLRFISEQAKQISGMAQRELLNIFCQMMPCGVIGGYVDEGFPLYVINDAMLEMMGYTYDEFVRDTDGMIVNSFYEDDAERVNNYVFEQLKNDTQYVVEYRVKKKDGGCMWVHDVGRKIVADDGRDAIISVLIDISSDVQSRMKLMEETSRDYLTGVYNRKGGAELVNLQMKNVMPYVFFMLDLDNFKRVNDHYGHDEGDKMLKFTGDLLKRMFRKTDIVMRLGGDEFAVFAYPCVDINVIKIKAEKVIEAYKKEAEKRYPLSRTSISIGGVSGTDTRTFPELYRQADEILYVVKQNGKGRCEIGKVI